MWFIRLFSYLPFPLIYAFSSALSFLVFRVGGYRRKVIQANLRNSFPNQSRAWYRRQELQFHKNFTDTWLEAIKALTISRTILFKRVQLQDYTVLDKYLKKEQTCVVLTSHIANWEWLALRCSAEPGFKTDIAYQEIQSPFINHLMFSIRGRFGAFLLERRKLLRALLQRKHLTRTIAMVADQGPSLKAELKHWWIFLNQPASFYTAAAKIAVSQNLPIIYSGMYRTRRGYYVGYFKEIGTPPYSSTSEVELTQTYIRLVEENVRQQPAGYLWSHRRWKRQPQPDDIIYTD